MPTYLVAGPSGHRLVTAATKAAAIHHVVKSEYAAQVATQQDLITRLTAGAKVEVAGEKAPDATATE